jgi:dihydrofolate reductase
MSLHAIVAMTSERVIGKDGDLPWRLPEDLKFFKKTTNGHPILMGRKTYDSIGKPLPGRQNIVLTRDQSWTAEGVEVIHELHQITSLRLIDPMVYVIGGAQIYELLLPHLDSMIVSWIYDQHEGDTHFPEFDSRFSKYKILDSMGDFEVRHYRR